MVDNSMTTYFNKLHVEAIRVSLKDTTREIKTILESLRNKCNNLFIQFIDEKAFYSKKQVALAYILSTKAFKEKYNRLRRQGLEFLLYLAATTQFNKAIERVGVKGKTACLIIIGEKHEDVEKCISKIKEDLEMLGTCKPNQEYIKKLYNIDEKLAQELCFQGDKNKCLEILILESIASIDYS